MAMRSTSLTQDSVIAIDREIGSQYDNVKIVADSIDDVETVADSITQVENVSDNITDVQTLANIKDKLNSLYVDKITLDSLYADKITLDSIYGDKTKLDSIYADKTILDSLYADKATLDSIFADKVKLDALYGSKDAIDSLYIDKAKLDSLYADKSTLDRLYTSINEIDRVYTSIDNIDTVHGNLMNIDVVAGDTVAINEIYSNRVEIYQADENASIATTKASEASASASAAATSESNASTSESNANTYMQNTEAMKLAVESIYDTFDDRFLGAKASDPSVDNDGNALQDGALYFNTTTNELNVYDLDSAEWLAIPSLTLAALNDVGLVTLTENDVLTWRGGSWTNTDEVIASSIQLSGGTGDEGTLSWNTDEETVDLIQNGAVLQIGQELHIHIRNTTASTIPNGTVVMATGTIGNSGKMTVAPYDGTSDIKFVVGITTEEIVAGDDGKVTNFGKIRNLDTSAWNDGDVLYTTSDGLMTNVQPTSGIVNAIAFVIHSHTNGTLMVRFAPHDENLHYTKSETDGLLDLKQDVLAEGAFVDGDKTKLNGIETNAKDDQVASEVPVTPVGNLSSNTVQSALEEIQTEVDGIDAYLGGLITEELV